MWWEAKCHLRYCDVKKTIGTCILINKSNLSVELEEKNIIFPIESLVNKFANKFIEKWKKMDLVELYRKAYRHTDDVKVLMEKAENLKGLNTSLITLKKMYTISDLKWKVLNRY